MRVGLGAKIPGQSQATIPLSSGVGQWNHRLEGSMYRGRRISVQIHPASQVEEDLALRQSKNAYDLPESLTSRIPVHIPAPF